MRRPFDHRLTTLRDSHIVSSERFRPRMGKLRVGGRRRRDCSIGGAVWARLRQRDLARPWASWIAPAAYAAFTLIGLIAVGRSGKLRYAPVLPFVFACLHFSYGFGVWLGLISPMTSRGNGLTSLDAEDALKRSHG